MSVKKRGDTIIEVLMAVSIFALLAVITIDLMNSGVSNAQRTLEYTMARNEIDNQAEALRFIHHSYVAERQLEKNTSQFRQLWDTFRSIAIPSKWIEDEEGSVSTTAEFDINNISQCSDAYGDNSMVEQYNAFVLNTRLIMPNPGDGIKYGGLPYSKIMSDIVIGAKVNSEDHDDQSQIVPAQLYPRIVYRVGRVNNPHGRDISSQADGSTTTDTSSLAEKQIYNLVDRAEGIFIIAVGDNKEEEKAARSNYYDFYIRTCWHSIGSRAPSTITTIVRLYNPEVIE